MSAIYALPQFRGRLRVEAGAKPGVTLKIKNRKRVIEEARDFIAAWSATEKAPAG